MFTSQTAAQSLVLRQLLRRGLCLSALTAQSRGDETSHSIFETIAGKLESARSATALVGGHQLTTGRSFFQKRMVVKRYLDNIYAEKFSDVLEQTIDTLKDPSLMKVEGRRQSTHEFIGNLIKALEAEKNTQAPATLMLLNMRKKNAGIRRF